MSLYQLQPHQASRGGGWRELLCPFTNYNHIRHLEGVGGGGLLCPFTNYNHIRHLEGVGRGGEWRGWVEGVGGGGGNCFPYIRIFVKLTS